MDNKKFSPVVGAVDLEVDNSEVEQFGFINLAESFDKGIIPGSVDLSDEVYNGVQNPGTLISRNTDVFDGLRKAVYVRNQLDRLNAEEREKAENAIKRASEKSGVHAENVTV